MMTRDELINGDYAALDALVSEFLETKRKYQGDDIANATETRCDAAQGLVFIRLPQGGGLELGKEFYCDRAKLRQMIDDLHRWFSR